MSWREKSWLSPADTSPGAEEAGALEPGGAKISQNILQISQLPGVRRGVMNYCFIEGQAGKPAGAWSWRSKHGVIYSLLFTLACLKFVILIK